ncbi:MAG: (Fe-S)-binding protein [Anaerolineales bacterium]|jgi:Fe-S oxidoreductase|nr:(Fe-S)-binding protein [Anaerolineales bacterium]HJN40491.1 (Fe-S)-binding protein [Anaerolineales bacterium]
MLTLTEKLLFPTIVLLSMALGYRNFRLVFEIVRRGQPDLALDALPQRMWRALEVFLSQRTVLRARPGTSLLHAFVAWGFTYYFLVNFGDVLEGFIPHFRFLGEGLLGGLYRLGADLLSVAVLVGVVYFLIRRFGTRAPQLTIAENVQLHPKASGGMRQDSLIVGVFILLHVGFRFIGASATIAAHGADAWQPFGSLAARLWGGLPPAGLVALEHAAWWLALGLILLFMPYFPNSKHLHLIIAPINYLTRPRRAALGALAPMDFDDPEMEEFGAQRLEQLGQTQLLDAFACIMCNRCQDVCPAYTTGKELSPAALEVNKRYMLKSDMAALASGAASAQLVGNAISESALWACTTCGACVEICPVGNEPMFDIVGLRRYQVLTAGEFPGQLQNAFNGMERQGNPWQMSEDRMGWTEGLDVPSVEENPGFEYLYWVGCAASFDPRAKEVARAFVKILNSAGVNYAVLGDQESCTGDTARRAGHEYLFFEMAAANIETLNGVGARRIVATCPHCLHSLGAEYSQFGADFEVIHHTTLINQLIDAGKLKLNGAGGDAQKVTFHDPCYLGRHNGVFADPRDVLAAGKVELLEMARMRNNSFCCGAGGGQMWKEEEPGQTGVSISRFEEAEGTGADTLAVGCPFCLVMLNDASRAAGESLHVRDVAEIVADSIT